METKMLHDEQPPASNGRTLGKQPGAVKAKQLGPAIPQRWLEVFENLSHRRVRKYLSNSHGFLGSEPRIFVAKEIPRGCWAKQCPVVPREVGWNSMLKHQNQFYGGCPALESRAS